MANNIQGIHTLLNTKDNGWVNEANGVVLSSHRTKEAAIDAGRTLAKRYATLLTVHRKDGTVISTKSYQMPVLPG